jgi:thymidine phosphorylase
MTTGNLGWSIVVAVVAVVAASGLALLLIPQLSLRATIQGGTIALLSMIGIRLVQWFRTGKQERG